MLLMGGENLPCPAQSQGKCWSALLHAISQPRESLAGPGGWTLVWPWYAWHCCPGTGMTVLWELWCGAEQMGSAMSHWHPWGHSPGERQRRTVQGTAGHTGSWEAVLLCVEVVFQHI